MNVSSNDLASGVGVIIPHFTECFASYIWSLKSWKFAYLPLSTPLPFPSSSFGFGISFAFT